MEATISQATRSEVLECATLLAKALGDDAILKAIIRGEPRDARLVDLYAAQLRSGPVQAGTVDVARIDGAIVGVAAWRSPDGDGFHPIQRLREARAVGRAHLADVRTLEHEFARHRPEAPHWYLTDLVVDPGHQGLGIGSLLLNYRLGRIDRERRPAYLEATTDASRRLYERHDFRFVDTINPAGPSAFAMLRPPRPVAP